MKIARAKDWSDAELNIHKQNTTSGRNEDKQQK
jgi:hypothetical protein